MCVQTFVPFTVSTNLTKTGKGTCKQFLCYLETPRQLADLFGLLLQWLTNHQGLSFKMIFKGFADLSSIWHHRVNETSGLNPEFCFHATRWRPYFTCGKSEFPRFSLTYAALIHTSCTQLLQFHSTIITQWTNKPNCEIFWHLISRENSSSTQSFLTSLSTGLRGATSLYLHVTHGGWWATAARWVGCSYVLPPP